MSRRGRLDRIPVLVLAFLLALPASAADLDGDGFVFEYSEDGGASWFAGGLPELPSFDQDAGLVAPLPATFSGTILIRVLDTDRTPGNRDLDTVSIDQLFLRAIP